MTILHIVASPKPGFAREDASGAQVIGAYTNPQTADLVRRVSGHDAVVSSIEVDHIPKGLRERIEAFGFKIPG